MDDHVDPGAGRREPTGAAVSALVRWRDLLGSWRIPDTILAAAPESPWGFPPELFREAGRSSTGGRKPVPTVRRATEALPRRGSVLDVGCGAGATSLPMADRVGRVTGVDAQPDMLEAFVAAAEVAGVAAQALHGRWPQMAAEAEAADVVVCGHVLYNVADAGPFVLELTRHARRRVVLEITGTHPLAWMSDLWLRFHGLERPSGPTDDDAIAAIRETGADPVREELDAGTDRGGGFRRRADAVALIRRRLCLPATMDGAIEAALGDRLREHDGLWSAGPSRRRLVTMWWDVREA
jgi:SAM-dependent methyltransferase